MLRVNVSFRQFYVVIFWLLHSSVFTVFERLSLVRVWYQSTFYSRVRKLRGLCLCASDGEGNVKRKRKMEPRSTPHHRLTRDEASPIMRPWLFTAQCIAQCANCSGFAATISPNFNANYQVSDFTCNCCFSVIIVWILSSVCWTIFLRNKILKIS